MIFVVFDSFIINVGNEIEKSVCYHNECGKIQIMKCAGLDIYTKSFQI